MTANLCSATVVRLPRGAGLLLRTTARGARHRASSARTTGFRHRCYLPTLFLLELLFYPSLGRRAPILQATAAYSRSKTQIPREDRNRANHDDCRWG